MNTRVRRLIVLAGELKLGWAEFVSAWTGPNPIDWRLELELELELDCSAKNF